MLRLFISPLLWALLGGLPVAAQAIAVAGAPNGTVAGSASTTSSPSAAAPGNGGAGHAPTHFQVTGTIMNVNGDAGTFQINGVTMSLASGAGVIGPNGQALNSLAQIKSGQTVQVTLTEVTPGAPTTGPRTAYSVRVIK